MLHRVFPFHRFQFQITELFTVEEKISMRLIFTDSSENDNI